MHEPRELYEQVILDHNRNPRNFLRLPEHANDHANRFASGDNPICGDEFSVSLQVEDGRITDIGFSGVGCAISVASTSLMTEAIRGKRVDEARALSASMRGLLTGAPVDIKQLGKLRILAGVRSYPMRVKCATLAWHILQAALDGETGTVCTEHDSAHPDECRLPPAA